MKILILTGRFGMGHVKTAAAIREQVSERWPDAQIAVVDLLDWMFPACSTAVYRVFGSAVRCIPSLYNMLNRAADRVRSSSWKKPVSARLRSLLAVYAPDLVISTLPLCSKCVSAYKIRTGATVPLFTFITDITVHADWITPQTAHYFVGAAQTGAALRDRGVPAGRITVSGIPVGRAFSAPHEPTQSAAQKKEVLLMGGGLGLLPAGDDLLAALAADPSVHVTLIAGKNAALARRTAKRFPQIETVGWTAEVARYLRRADLLLTKAGGITTFEAIAAGTPLCILHPFLAQEIGNASYIEQMRIGRVFWTPQDCTAANVLALVHDETALARLRAGIADLRADQKSPAATIREAFVS